jgi:Raf kinase inhibitor-like YbhB/YbcL family protein
LLIYGISAGLNGACSGKKKEPAQPVIQNQGSGQKVKPEKRGFALTSPSFDDSDFIPLKHTCDGEDISPELRWINLPDGTKSFALICHDPDAPGGDWVHWVLYIRSGDRRMLPENLPKELFLQGIGVQGKNDFGKYGYGGPCPPKPSTHRYYFELLALDTKFEIPEGITRDQLESTVRDHVIGIARLMGKYKRK